METEMSSHMKILYSSE